MLFNCFFQVISACVFVVGNFPNICSVSSPSLAQYTKPSTLNPHPDHLLAPHPPRAQQVYEEFLSASMLASAMLEYQRTRENDAGREQRPPSQTDKKTAPGGDDKASPGEFRSYTSLSQASLS